MCARHLQAGAARRQIDDANFDGGRVRTDQKLSTPRDQPPRRHPEPTSFIGLVHARLCDKTVELYITR